MFGRAAQQKRRARRARFEQKLLAVQAHHVVGEAVMHKREQVIGERPALPAVNAQRAELGLHPAYA